MRTFVSTLLILVTSLFAFSQVRRETALLIDSLNHLRGESTKRLDLLKKISYDLRVENPDSAIFYAQKGLELAKKSNLPHYIGGFYQRIGIAHRIQGEYLFAIVMYKKAEDSYASIGAQEGLAGVYNSLGILFSVTKNYTQAISYFEKLIELDRSQKYYPGLVLTYCNLAGIYTDKKDLDKAEHYYQKALDIHREFNITTNQVTLWNNIGGLQLQQNNADSALSCYKKSLAYNTTNDPKSRMHSLLGIGQVLKAEDPLQAERFLLEARDIAMESDNKRVKADINLALSFTYKNQNKFDMAFHYLSAYTSLKDSLFSSELIEQLNELEIKYETEKKELEIANEKRKNVFSYIATAAMVIILFLVVNRLLAQKKINRISKEKLENEVDYKNRLLASRTVDLSNFSKLLIDFNTKVEESKGEPSDKLASIIKKSIKQKLKDVDDWQQMKIHFEEVHPDFFKKIQSIEPPLTSNEQKHCAYIKMKLNNKDIARMLNVNLSSIHVVHHRLKKKLSLKESDSLSQYIANL